MKDFRHMYPHFRLSAFVAEENWKIDFTADESSGKAAIASFPPLTEEETGKSTLPPMRAAVKLQLPVFLLCERRKTGHCSFTAALISGKVHFTAFLRSERRKTGNWRYAAGTYGGSVSIRFLILFSLLLPVGGSWVGA